MPMTWPDYWQDTGHLNGAQHGAYLNLIGRYWCSRLPLPDDDDQLWRLAAADSRKAWLGMRSVVLKFFRLELDGWRHKRIDLELDKAVAITQARSEAGKRGANGKWHGKAGDKQDGKRIATPQQTHRQTDGPLPKKDSVPNGTDAGGVQPMSVYDTGESLLLAAGAFKTADSARGFIAKLCKGGHEEAVAGAIEEIRDREKPPVEIKSAMVEAVNRRKSNGQQHRAAKFSEPNAADRLRDFAARGVGGSPADPGWPDE